MAFPNNLTNAVDGVTDVLADHLNNLEAKVGIDGSLVTTSLDYLLKNSASVDPGHKHTISALSSLAANSLVGNNTGVPATPLALSAAQVKTLLAIAQADVSGLTTASSPTFAALTAASLTSAGALGLNAGGSNQNVTLTPSGTGYTVLNGQVGVGITTPTAKLHIRSTGAIYYGTPTLRINESSNRATVFIESETDNPIDQFYRVNNQNTFNYAIRASNESYVHRLYRYATGDSTPSVAWEISRATGNMSIGPDAADSSIRLLVTASDASNTFPGAASVRIRNTDAGNFGRMASLMLGSSAGIAGVYDNYNAINGGGHILTFYTKDSATEANPSEKMRLTKSGWLGIRNTAPAAVLEVGSPTYSTNIDAYITARGANSLRSNLIFRVLDSGGANAGGTVGSNGGGLFLSGNTAVSTHLTINSSGQVGIGTQSPNAAALMHLSSTTMGFLPPVMTTTQKTAISSPPAGLVVYDSTLNKLCLYTGSAWQTVTSA
jgi:hypothetical protein